MENDSHESKAVDHTLCDEAMFECVHHCIHSGMAQAESRSIVIDRATLKRCLTDP